MPKQFFSFRLGFFVLGIHVVALFLLLRQSIGMYDGLEVNASQNYLIGADVIIVPFKKVIKEQPICANKSAVPASSDATVFKEIKKPVQKKPAPVAKKDEPKKNVPKKPEAVMPKPVQTEQKKEVEKPLVENQSIEKPKPMPAQTPIEQPVLEEKKPLPVLQSEKQYIGTKQLSMLQIQQAIVDQVQMHWQPPAGFEPECAVILSVDTDSFGEVVDVITQQSSGICVYDIHARSAVYQMRFPKACWGNKITIAFN